MKGSPAFQFYPADWLSDEHVSLMSNAQEGIYVRLMSMCWREGSIPGDLTALQGLAAKMGILPSPEDVRVVQGRFNQSPTDPSRLVHLRLEAEREKQAAWAAKSSEGGKKSAESRRKKAKQGLKGGSTVVEPKGNSSSSSSSSSSDHPPIVPPLKSIQEIEVEAAAVFQLYPRVRTKDGKTYPVVVGDNARDEILCFMVERPDYPLLEAVRLLRDVADMPPNLTNFLAKPWDLGTLRESAAARKSKGKEKTPEPDGPTVVEAATRREHAEAEARSPEDQAELERMAAESLAKTGIDFTPPDWRTT